MEMKDFLTGSYSEEVTVFIPDHREILWDN
jgi:hypothetical protein